MVKVYLLQYSHSDPGYTHPRDEVWRLHIRNFAQAVEYCRLDKDFRWTVETFWVIDEALRRGRELPEGFLELVREGRIGLGCKYFNGSDHLDETDYRKLLAYAREFCREYELPLKSALQNDINGVSAQMPDLLSDVGVNRYFMGINDDRGTAPFVRPNAFWWRGPGGGKLLCYNAWVYVQANIYGMHTGWDGFRVGVERMRQDISDANYSLPVLALAGCGTYDDNGLPGLWMAEMARKWRAEEDSELEFIPATVDEFFDALENCGSEFPEYTGTMPDWWSDGHLSAPLETMRTYQARRVARAIEPLLGDEQKRRGTSFEEIQRSVWFYFEHTFGSWRAISQPEAPDSRRQWADKMVLAHRGLEEAEYLAEELLANRAKSGFCAYFPPDCVTPQYIEMEIPRRHVKAEGEILIAPNPAELRASIRLPENEEHPAQLVVWAKPKPGELVEFQQSGFSEGQFGQENGTSSENPGIALVSERPTGGRKPVNTPFAVADFQRTSAEFLPLSHVSTPLWKADRWRLESLDGWRDVKVEKRQWHFGDVAEYVLNGIVGYEPKPLSTFCIFDWSAEAAEIWCETGGYWHRPGMDELPNACRDWHVAQQGVEVRLKDGTSLALWTPDAPLVHFGGINTGKWGRGVTPQSGALAIPLYTNYWYTNFAAAAPGELTYRFRMANCASSEEARKFLRSWNAGFLVFYDTIRGKELRERRVSRLREVVG